MERELDVLRNDTLLQKLLQNDFFYDDICRGLKLGYGAEEIIRIFTDYVEEKDLKSVVVKNRGRIKL